jgi:hypothetical protein
MRISERKQPAAVLRFILGEKLDDDFCALVGCSRDLWRKLENGDRKMTERMAAQVESATGVSRVWLLAGNAKAKPVAIDGQPYTLETFRAFQAAQLTGERKALAFAVYPGGYLPSLVAVAHSAAEQGKLASFAVELEAAVNALRQQYGFSAEVFGAVVRDMQTQAGAYLFESTDLRKDVEGAHEARIRQALACAAAGAFPIAATIQHGERGKSRTSKVQMICERLSSSLLQTEPRSKRAKARP